MTESRATRGGAVIDLAHLEAQTMGNAALAREVLGLFVGQARTLLATLRTPAGRSAEAAHKLVGSARGLGLAQVATSARALEDALRAGGSGEREFEALDVAVGLALAAIAAHLDEA